MDFLKLANGINTPFYLYDFNEIENRFNSIKKAFSGAKNNIFYAVKANSNLSLLKFLANLDSGFDCVSANEIRRALKVGAKPYKIIFSGVGKSASELEFAIEQKILYINVESSAELELLESIAKSKNQVVNISIRVNPNIDAKTHPYISTGLKENKFGVSLDNARAMFLKAHKSDYLNPVGVHFHIGSNILELSSIIQAAILVEKFIKELNTAGLNIKFFDIGGGVGIKYKNDEIEPNLDEFAHMIKNIAKAQDLTICCEPGRYIVGNAGYLVSKVLYEKINEGKRFVICDASMCELIRPSLYEAYHEILSFPSVNKLNESSKADLVGGVCESGDFLAKDIVLPPLMANDLVVIKSSGAYGFVMSSNYNSRTKVAEYSLYNNELKLINKAQSFDELIANELSCL
ncbi:MULTISPECIES: diaminopimelate decarboxylase [unclassified Campylobacter]|uniref:diaminopimelate decarboxylase n=1 Tax=unclassified Campylobacter TaxID=2593542 RepID=UPI001BDAC576|nr:MULTISPECIES: diaminopimelate decarboxylase [unclassified Campylobacter]MBZ7975359.1 diaminopimelate decarboxylase [Campylobacter sp. RM12637]MBZ7977194.1 diaminopimelate decarboxylase [Campylobacter sp. RM12654]MBZ7981706.1 diaminopimelate decarboxylase [Campylobacter sp. RM12640]MBZ7988585.1 diaminopimelate decarboxylase [Campylobacter sp. RM12635]MBZ7990255.1 diaminopimelate decarboxylase [Campylobacter sp. RM9331]MBZ7993216.1 diaminopimelate decarboxylase [Campylobacter sp. RM9333]MBZ